MSCGSWKIFPFSPEIGAENSFVKIHKFYKNLTTFFVNFTYKKTIDKTKIL